MSLLHEVVIGALSQTSIKSRQEQTTNPMFATNSSPVLEYQLNISFRAELGEWKTKICVHLQNLEGSRKEIEKRLNDTSEAR